MVGPTQGTPRGLEFVCRLARVIPDDMPSSQRMDAVALQRAVDAAHIHNALGEILPALLEMGGDLPAPLRAKLATAETAFAAQALIRESELKAVLKILKVAGLDVVLLKGAFLASCVYEDFAQRPMSDFDLLLRREDLPRAAAALRQAGYQCEDPSGRDAAPGGASHFRSPAGHAIELRCDLTQGARLRGVVDFAEAEMWERRRTFESRTGDRILSLDPTDHLLYLAYHAGILHLFTALVWLIDVDRFIRRFGEEIAWADLARRARRVGCATCLWHCLGLARQYLGTHVEDSVLQALRPEKLRAAIVRRWLTGRRLLRGLKHPTWIRMVMHQMILLDTTSADLRSLWQGLLPRRRTLESD